ncbi:unnamed protein product, partial [Polarella glacialis]
LLLQARCSTNARRFDGKTALMVAAEAGRSELVPLLAGNKADLEAQADNGSTALSVSLAAQHLGTLEALASAGCDLNTPLATAAGGALCAPLVAAAVSGDLEVLKLLVRCRASLDPVSLALIPQDRQSLGKKATSRAFLPAMDVVSAVAAAAAVGRWPVVRLLVELAANPDAGSKVGTALILAAKAGELATVNFLCASGAALNAVDASGRTALCWAASAGHLEMLKALSAAKADLDFSASGSDLSEWGELVPLVAASSLRKWAAVQLLLELGASTDGRDGLGRTALILAAAQGQVKTVCSLLQRHARLEVRGDDGETALAAAAREKQWQVLQGPQSAPAGRRRLAEARADLEASQWDAISQSACLCLGEAKDTMLHLAKHGANLEVAGNGGRTVLMLVADCGQDDVAWTLLQCRACPNATDDKAETALLRACNRQLTGMMRILWEGGASIESAVRQSRIPAMGVLLRRWSGEVVDDM